MPRRRQQYRRPPPPLPRQPWGPSAEAIEIAATRLAASHSGEELRLLVGQIRQARDVADQRAQAEPGPAALYRFREVSQHLVEAERACALAETAEISAST